MNDVLMEIRDLIVSYKTRLGGLSAVDGIDFDTYKGESHSLVGKGGCRNGTM